MCGPELAGDRDIAGQGVGNNGLLEVGVSQCRGTCFKTQNHLVVEYLACAAVQKF